MEKTFTTESGTTYFFNDSGWYRVVGNGGSEPDFVKVDFDFRFSMKKRALIQRLLEKYERRISRR